MPLPTPKALLGASNLVLCVALVNGTAARASPCAQQEHYAVRILCYTHAEALAASAGDDATTSRCSYKPITYCSIGTTFWGGIDVPPLCFEHYATGVL